MKYQYSRHAVMFGWVCIINMQLLRSVLVNNLAMFYIIIDMQYLCGWHMVVCCGIVIGCYQFAPTAM